MKWGYRLAGFGVGDVRPHLNVPNANVRHPQLGKSVFVGSMVANRQALKHKKAESAVQMRNGSMEVKQEPFVPHDQQRLQS